MKFLRIFLVILMLFVAVAVLAVGTILYMVDPNKLKPVIVRTVYDHTGYNLSIDGKISWSFYPRLAFHIDKMALKAPHQTSEFLQLEDIKLGTSIDQLWNQEKRLEGTFSIATLKFANLSIQNTNGTMSWQNKQLIIDPLTASFYGGSLQGTFQANGFTTSLPQFNFDVVLTDIIIQSLLKDALGEDTKLKISGVGYLKLKGVTQGKTRDDIFSNLNGASEFHVHNGALAGIDLNYFIQAADALIHKQPLPPPPTVQQTAFNELTGTATITKGVVQTNNLLLTSSAFLTKGIGSYVLQSQALNLDLQVQSQENSQTQWQIPIQVRGDLHHPDVRLDIKDIQKLLFQRELDRVKERAREQINKRIPGKAGEFLQNLLGR